MLRSAQVSLFLTIVLLVAVLFSLVLSQNLQEIPLIQETANVQLSISGFVESCLRDSLESSLPLIGMQGGYYHPENNVPFHNFSIAIYFQDNRSHLPTLGTIESEISLGIGDKMRHCVDDFVSFRGNGMDITAKEMEITTTIQADTISATLHYPLKIISGNKKETLETFHSKINFDFPSKYLAVASFVERQTKDTEHIPLSELGELALAHGFLFDIIDLGDKKIVFIFSFKADEDNKPFIYAFAHEYS